MGQMETMYMGHIISINNFWRTRCGVITLILLSIFSGHLHVQYLIWSFTENLNQVSSCYFPKLHLRKRPLRPVQAIFYSPLGETTERGNGMLRANSRLPNSTEQRKSWIITSSAHIIVPKILFLFSPTLCLQDCGPLQINYIFEQLNVISGWTMSWNREK